MRKSRITFEIDSRRVATIVELLMSEVSNFRVEEIAGSGDRGRQIKSVTWLSKGSELVLEHMSRTPTKEFYYKDLCPLMETANLARSSISPILSHLASEGKVEKTKRGHYRVRS